MFCDRIFALKSGTFDQENGKAVDFDIIRRLIPSILPNQIACALRSSFDIRVLFHWHNLPKSSAGTDFTQSFYFAHAQRRHHVSFVQQIFRFVSHSPLRLSLFVRAYCKRINCLRCNHICSITSALVLEQLCRHRTYIGPVPFKSIRMRTVFGVCVCVRVRV